jgi:hypothetical protein
MKGGDLEEAAAHFSHRELLGEDGQSGQSLSLARRDSR